LNQNLNRIRILRNDFCRIRILQHWYLTMNLNSPWGAGGMNMGCGTSMGRTGTLIIIGGMGGMGGRGGMVCCGMGGAAAAAGMGGGATTTVFTIGSIGSGMRPFCLWIWAIWSLRLQQEPNLLTDTGGF
jgi:hypothetical protein